MANTRSPWRRPLSGSSASSAPWPTAPEGRRTARSWRGSASTTSAGTSRPSLVTTLTAPPSRMTWLLVTMRPEGDRMTPLPWLLPARTWTTVVWTRETALARSDSVPTAGGGVVVAAGVSSTWATGAASSPTSSAVTAPTPPASTRPAATAATRPRRRRETRRFGTAAGRSRSAPPPRSESGAGARPAAGRPAGGVRGPAPGAGRGAEVPRCAGVARGAAGRSRPGLYRGRAKVGLNER